ncbi:MAG: oligosaccharide flippase family protein [Agathobaculum sp.]|uniref:oligosaccharide flippase family protein n=1 Tax=Agathobaculum sp. TaxID=2048138 RepID=UPI003D8A8399
MRIQKRTILYDASILACGNLLLQALGFFYRILLSHFAGAEGLGVYRLVNSVYLVLNAGCLSGVTMACSRLTAASRARGERKQTGAVLRLSFSAFFMLCTACTAVILLLREPISIKLLGDGRCARAFPFLALCLALTGVENIFKALFIGLEKMQYTAASEVGEQLVRICAVGVLLFQYRGNEYGTIAMLIFAGMVVSEIFSALLLTWLFHKNIPGVSLHTQINGAMAGQFFRIALPLSASALIGNLISSAGAILLPQRLMLAGMTYEQALSALGVISGMALPLLLLPVALVSSVNTALLPAVTAAQARGNRARVCALTGRAITTVGLIAFPATAVLVPLAPRLSELFFRQPLTPEYVSLLGAVAIASYYQMVTAGLLNALGLQHLSVVTGVLAECMQIVLLYRWCALPSMGVYGYLLAMLLTSAGAFGVNVCILHRRSRFALHPFRRFGVPILCGATLFGWTRFFYGFFRNAFRTEAGALLCTLIGAAALYTLVLRLLGVRLLHYLGQRIEKTQFPRICTW